MTDYRNDVALAEACKTDVEALCAGVEPGEARCRGQLRAGRSLCRVQGTVCAAPWLVPATCQTPAESQLHLVCLTKSRTSDLAIGAAPTRPPDTPVLLCLAGEGRVHACLRQHMDRLTEDCRREELKLAIIQVGFCWWRSGLVNVWMRGVCVGGRAL